MNDRINDALATRNLLATTFAGVDAEIAATESLLSELRVKRGHAHKELSDSEEALADMYLEQMGETPDWSILLDPENGAGVHLNDYVKKALFDLGFVSKNKSWENKPHAVAITVPRNTSDQDLELLAQKIVAFSIHLKPHENGVRKFFVNSTRHSYPFGHIMLSLSENSPSVNLEWVEMITKAESSLNPLHIDFDRKSIDFETLQQALVYVREIMPGVAPSLEDERVLPIFRNPIRLIVEKETKCS
jgi:hypothetical protein